MADVAVALVGSRLTSTVVCDFVSRYFPSHLYPTSVRSDPLSHSQCHSERQYIEERRCCVLWDSCTAFCLSDFSVRILHLNTLGSERSHLTNTENITTHISMTVQSPAVVSTAQGCCAPTNTAAYSTREARQRGLQQISLH